MKDDVDERFDSSGCSYGHGYSESAWKPVELKSGSSVFFNGLVLLRNVASSFSPLKVSIASLFGQQIKGISSSVCKSLHVGRVAATVDQ